MRQNYLPLHCTALHCTALHCTQPHCTQPHYTLQSSALHSSTLHSAYSATLQSALSCYSCSALRRLAAVICSCTIRFTSALPVLSFFSSLATAGITWTIQQLGLSRCHCIGISLALPVRLGCYRSSNWQQAPRAHAAGSESTPQSHAISCSDRCTMVRRYVPQQYVVKLCAPFTPSHYSKSLDCPQL
jgi:hypothetical protein